MARQLARRGRAGGGGRRRRAAQPGGDTRACGRRVGASHRPGGRRMRDYVEEKTGARPGEGAGGILVLNPDTTDLVDRLSVEAPDGVRLVVMGGVRQAGGGCLCPETALDLERGRRHAPPRRRRGDHGHPRRRRALRPGPGPRLRLRRGRRRPDLQRGRRWGSSRPRWPLSSGSRRVHLVVNRVRSEGDSSGCSATSSRWAASCSPRSRAVPYDEVGHRCRSRRSTRLLEGSSLAIGGHRRDSCSTEVCSPASPAPVEAWS